MRKLIFIKFCKCSSEIFNKILIRGVNILDVNAFLKESKIDRKYIWIYKEIPYDKMHNLKEYNHMVPQHNIRIIRDTLFSGNDAIIYTKNEKSNIFNFSNQTSYYDDKVFFDDSVEFYATFGDIDSEAYIFIKGEKLLDELIIFIRKNSKIKIVDNEKYFL